MANEVAKKSNSFSVALTGKLDEMTEALPKDLNKSRFVANAVALMNNADDKLKACSQAQIIQGLVKTAVLGLDAMNKEVYLIPYGTKVNVQLDYRGAVKLAKKYSIRPIKDIYAEVVREGDDFQYSVVNGEPTLDFKPVPFNNGKTIGAFAVCLYQDGGKLIDTMSLADLENTRKKSKSANKGAWADFTNEMYKKTVLHRLCKHVELDFDSPQQRQEFDADMEIETDIKELAKNDIEENANQTEFVVDAEFTEVSEDDFGGTPFK